MGKIQSPLAKETKRRWWEGVSTGLLAAGIVSGAGTIGGHTEVIPATFLGAACVTWFVCRREWR